MAQKRSIDSVEDNISPKMLKLVDTNDSDLIMDNCNLSTDLKSSLEYDFVMKSFSATIEKERKDGNRWICLGHEDINNIIKLLPVVENLIRRYSAKRSPKVIDLPFETSCGEIGDMVTVIL